MVKRMASRIVIIEDEKDIVRLLKFNLEKEGFATKCAFDGNAGLEAARLEHPDLVVLDLMLPGIMGTEVCKALRKDPRTARIPVRSKAWELATWIVRPGRSLEFRIRFKGL